MSLSIYEDNVSENIDNNGFQDSGFGENGANIKNASGNAVKNNIYFHTAENANQLQVSNNNNGGDANRKKKCGNNYNNNLLIQCKEVGMKKSSISLIVSGPIQDKVNFVYVIFFLNIYLTTLRKLSLCCTRKIP